MSGRPPRDLTGQRFGRLTALERISRPPDRAAWRCRCECGNITFVGTAPLQNGSSQSCGCLSKELVAARRKTHGCTGNGGHDVTAEYTAWRRMKARCLNPKRPDWHNYGGRGIAVCERWLKDFPAFLADMGPRPSSSHSLDRIDNSGHYEPSNCRWATPSEQGNNTRVNRRLEHNGQTKTVAEWAKALGFTQNQLLCRLRYGWSVADTLTIPVSRTHSHRSRA